MPTNYTPNYSLSQWEPEDKVIRTDFNADNAKIDAALKAEADARTAAEQSINQALALKADSSTVSSLSGTVSGHTSALAKKGNCQIYTTSYTGTGTYGASGQSSLSFPAKPMVVFLCGNNGLRGILLQGQDGGFCSGLTGGVGLFAVTWSGNTVKWYNHMAAESQMNAANTTYLVVALLAL